MQNVVQRYQQINLHLLKLHPRDHGKGYKSELRSKPPDPPTRETQAFNRGQSDQAGSAIYLYVDDYKELQLAVNKLKG